MNSILLNQSLGIDNFSMERSGISLMKRSVMLTFLDYQVGKVIKSINVDEMRKKKFTIRFRSVYGENDMVESIENCASRHSMLVIEGETVVKMLANFEEFKRDLSVVYY